MFLAWLYDLCLSLVVVDTDAYLLETYRGRAEPLIADYLVQRRKPYKIEVFEGSISTPSDYLQNTDVVIALEVIEHLYADVLIDVPYNIFGFIKPKVVLISTPNQEYNVLFPHLSGGFRHSDHKFEWTREEFKAWALNICERFPNYLVNIFGVGKPPEDRTEVGHVSQYAIFVRKDVVDQPLVENIDPVLVETLLDKEYRLVYSMKIPARWDNRTVEEKIYDRAAEFILRYGKMNEDDYEYVSQNFYSVPIPLVLNSVSDLTDSMPDLIRILEHGGYLLKDRCVIMPVEREMRTNGYWLDDQLDDYSDEEDHLEDRRRKEEDEASFNQSVDSTNQREENWDEDEDNGGNQSSPFPIIHEWWD